jgi:uncharacterized phiE125 gp8 family phage protein
MAAVRLVQGPTELPISVDEVKLRLRVDDDESDAVIEDYIEAATDAAQKFTGRALRPQTWELSLDAFPDMGSPEIVVPHPPLREVLSIKYDDGDGLEQTVSANDYQVDTVSEPGWILPNADFTWPTPLEAINSIRVLYVAGYGGDSPGGAIPKAILQAITLMVRYWYDGGQQVDVYGMPPGAEPLLRKYRVLRGMA